MQDDWIPKLKKICDTEIEAESYMLENCLENGFIRRRDDLKYLVFEWVELSNESYWVQWIKEGKDRQLKET